MPTGATAERQPPAAEAGAQRRRYNGAMPERVIDTLIIGQGLAGSLLAWTLARRGQRVLVCDDHQAGSASRVAAGVLNPLAGMRFTRPAHVDEWLAAARDSYRALERTLHCTLLHRLPMVRLLRSPEQRRFYERQAADPASQPYLGEAFAAGGSGYRLGDAHGGFHQYQAGYLDTGALLDGLAEWLSDQGALRLGPVSGAELRPTADGVRLGDMRARRAVCCEGWRVRDNPWFDWLPMQPAKGEILTLAGDPAQPDALVAGQRWLLPLADGRRKLGATVEHQQLDTRPTDAARDTLLADYRALLPEAPPPVVLDQQAGVRPNTQDRKPLLGAHPQHPELMVFNGFGGRGSLTIPWYAARFADWLEGRADLPAEADIRRLVTA